MDQSTDNQFVLSDDDIKINNIIKELDKEIAPTVKPKKPNYNKIEIKSTNSYIS